METHRSIEVNEKYTYKPLGEGQKIRILNLWPAETWDAPIQCTLEEVALDNLDGPPQYTALSYSWATEDGHATASKVIELDAIPFPVTENLYNALRRLRSEGPAIRDAQERQKTSVAELKSHGSSRPGLFKTLLRGMRLRPYHRGNAAKSAKSIAKLKASLWETGRLSLWIDALCINQQDDTEKSQQVAMMGDIYRLAETVIAWLGESGNALEDAAAYDVMQCFLSDGRVSSAVHRRLGERSDRRPTRESALHHESPGSVPRLDGDKQQIDKSEPTPKICPNCGAGTTGQTEKSTLRSLDEFSIVQRRYFKRRWVVQEINLPEEGRVFFKWGAYMASRRDLTEAVTRYQRVAPMPESDSTFLDSNYSIGDGWINPALDTQVSGVARLLERCKPGASLYELLEVLHPMDCSDPRDRLYALFALAYPDTHVVADYSCSVAEVFTKFSRKLVDEHMIGTLFRFCSGVGKPTPDPIPNLPSWALDLRFNFNFANSRRRGFDLQFEFAGGIERCQASWSADGILSISLYQIRVVRKLMTPTQRYWEREESEDDADWDRVILGYVRDGSRTGLRYSELEVNDILCTLLPAEASRRNYKVKLDLASYSYVLRPVQHRELENAVRILGKFRSSSSVRAYMKHEPQLVRFNIV